MYRDFSQAGFAPMNLGGGLWAFVREAENVVAVVANSVDVDRVPDSRRLGCPVDLSLYPTEGVGGPASLTITFSDAITLLESLTGE